MGNRDNKTPARQQPSDVMTSPVTEQARREWQDNESVLTCSPTFCRHHIYILLCTLLYKRILDEASCAGQESSPDMSPRAEKLRKSTSCVRTPCGETRYRREVGPQSTAAVHSSVPSRGSSTHWKRPPTHFVRLRVNQRVLSVVFVSFLQYTCTKYASGQGYGG